MLNQIEVVPAEVLVDLVFRNPGEVAPPVLIFTQKRGSSLVVALEIESANSLQTFVVQVFPLILHKRSPRDNIWSIVGEISEPFTIAHSSHDVPFGRSKAFSEAQRLRWEHPLPRLAIFYH